MTMSGSRDRTTSAGASANANTNAHDRRSRAEPARPARPARPEDVAEKAPLRLAPEHPVLATGIALLDRILPGGGLPRGGLVEFSGAPSSGKTSLAFACIAAAQARGEETAFIDPRRCFHGPAAAAAGIDLDRLLVVRPPRDKRGGGGARSAAGRHIAAFSALDHLLQSTGFALVVLDLAESPEAPPLDRLFRVARTGKVRETTALLLTESLPERPSLGSPVMLRLAARRTGLRLAPEPRTPFALGGSRIEVTLLKCKTASPSGRVVLDLEPDLGG